MQTGTLILMPIGIKAVVHEYCLDSHLNSDI